MNLKIWPRALSNEDLEIVTEWHCLADKRPESGQTCEYRIVADKWSGKTETGRWKKIDTADITVAYGDTHAFFNDFGMFCTDPNQTYWRLKPKNELSRIDYVCGEPNEMQVSGYDIFSCEDDVVAWVEKMARIYHKEKLQ